jgi:c(7)-type cytochrome triheme protein
MTEGPRTPAQNSSTSSSERATSRKPLLSLSVLITGALAFTVADLSGSRTSSSRAESQGQLRPAVFQNAGGDYSRFTHANAAHSRLPCLLCHRRENNSPRPVRSSGHTPCAGCHAEQFANSASPICTICHTAVGGSNPPVKPFPSLKSFNMKFDHARHQGTGCSTCHKPAGRGVALSIPAGLNAHETCYKCHAPRAQADGRDISSCGTCHRLGQYARAQVFTKAYRVSFSHAKHGERQDLNCNDCHSVRAAKATAPVPSQHFGSARAQSCRNCHNNTRAFGGDDFSDCKRCHQGDTFRF